MEQCLLILVWSFPHDLVPHAFIIFGLYQIRITLFEDRFRCFLEGISSFIQTCIIYKTKDSPDWKGGPMYTPGGIYFPESFTGPLSLTFHKLWTGRRVWVRYELRFCQRSVSVHRYANFCFLICLLGSFLDALMFSFVLHFVRLHMVRNDFSDSWF